MDITDIATNYEEVEREALISAARRQSNPALMRRRQLLADARALAGQRGPNDPEVQTLGMECHNECGEPLPVAADDVFCCKECAEDWEARERMRTISGNRH